MFNALKVLFHMVIIFLLTLLTQIGGVIHLAALLFVKKDIGNMAILDF